MRNEGSQKEVTKAEFITLRKMSYGCEVFIFNMTEFILEGLFLCKQSKKPNFQHFIHIYQ